MKCTRSIVVATAALLFGGPLSIWLADSLPAQEKKAAKVPHRYVHAAYRHHHHHYVEASRNYQNCFLFFCVQEAPKVHPHVEAPKRHHHHHYAEAPKHHHHYVEAPKFRLRYFGGPKYPHHYVQVYSHFYDHDED